MKKSKYCPTCGTPLNELTGETALGKSIGTCPTHGKCIMGSPLRVCLNGHVVEVLSESHLS